MQEFQNFVERIFSGLKEITHENGSVMEREIEEIVRKAIGQDGGRPVNCYPGTACNTCHKLAFFIALQGSVYAKGRNNHLTCRQALEKVVQHMQGSCLHKTHHAILITTHWDDAAFEEWKANLFQMSNEASFEVYLLVGGNISPLIIKPPCA